MRGTAKSSSDPPLGGVLMKLLALVGRDNDISGLSGGCTFATGGRGCT